MDGRSSWRARLARHPTAVDGAVAAALWGIGVLYLRLAADLTAVNMAWGSISLATVVLPLALRRRYPIAVLAVVTAAFSLYRLTDVEDTMIVSIAMFVAFYSVGANTPRPPANWVRSACLAAMAALLGYTLFVRDIDLGSSQLSVILFHVYALAVNAFFFAAAWLMGDAVHDRAQHERELAERAADLERAQAAIAERAVVDERVRIARELHDVVAHHVSVMGVQAGAVRRVLARDPEAAAGALRAIEDTSRQAVAELHRLLGFLRREGEADGVAPQPSLRDLDALVAQMTDARLEVRLRVEGTPRPLPPGVDLAAYRVAQEALTNTLKHAGPMAHAALTLTYGPDTFDLAVIDNGARLVAHGRTGAPEPGGRGLVGMRERVALHGGSLAVGTLPGAGFAVRASFPTGGG